MIPFDVTARYSDGSGFFGERVFAPDAEAAKEYVRAIMWENGDDDPDEIEFVECEPADLVREAAPDLLAALCSAESFIAGFEGDEIQEGIDDLIAEVRAAIAKATGAGS